MAAHATLFRARRYLSVVHPLPQKPVVVYNMCVDLEVIKRRFRDSARRVCHGKIAGEETLVKGRMVTRGGGLG